MCTVCYITVQVCSGASFYMLRRFPLLVLFHVHDVSHVYFVTQANNTELADEVAALKLQLQQQVGSVFLPDPPSYIKKTIIFQTLAERSIEHKSFFIEKWLWKKRWVGCPCPDFRHSPLPCPLLPCPMLPCPAPPCLSLPCPMLPCPCCFASPALLDVTSLCPALLCAAL